MPNSALTCSPPSQRSGSPPRKKSSRSRAGCKQCKVSRKKCDEARPRCSRCAKRDLECKYLSAPRQRHSPSPETPNTTRSFTSPRIAYGNAASGVEFSNIASLVDPTISLSPHAVGYPSPFATWAQPDRSNYDLEDLTSSLEFIESAFPRINHVSPGSTTSADRVPVSSVDSLSLWEHEQIYLVTFQDAFWQVIARKEEDPSAGNVYFAQLAGFAPLKYAILAVGAAWQAQTDPTIILAQAIVDESVRLHSKAIRGLKVSIGNKAKSPWNAIIACTFCLLFYDLIRGDVSTGPTHHLLGALHLMKIDKNAGLNRTSTFHHKLFRYYDVIAALSLARHPLTGSLTYQDDNPSIATHKVDDEQLNDPYGCVDNVFGLATSLWPLLHRLAQLTRTTSPTETTSPSSFTSSSPAHILLTQKHNRISLAALELSLKEWKPQLELYAVNMEHAASDSSLQSLLQNAEACRYAALVHLYSHSGDARGSSRVQNAVQAALQCCLRVMVFGKPFGGLLWPLFTAGASAITPNHRKIASTVCDQLLEVQGLANIANAKRLLEEVWRQMDDSDEILRWQDVAKKLGWSVVLA